MRRRRNAAPPTVGVTGAATGLGRAVLERLAASAAAPVAVGIAPFEDGPRRETAPTDPELARQLTGVGTVLHLALSYDTSRDPRARRAANLAGTAALLDAARVAGVARVVLVTSLDVHASPPPGTPVPHGEDLPLRDDPDSALTEELLEVERLADHATRTGLDVLVLRPAAVVGGPLGPAYDGQSLHALHGPRLLAVRGVEPLWQVCHSDDLVSALVHAATTDLSGSAAVASAGWLAQRDVEQLARRRRLELPASVAVSTAERLHRVGVTPGTPAELDRLLSPLVVEPRRLAATGWAPTWTTADALAAHLAQRGSGGRAGTYTAAGAGATVALVGTAALVRRARRRRRGR